MTQINHGSQPTPSQSQRRKWLGAEGSGVGLSRAVGGSPTQHGVGMSRFSRSKWLRARGKWGWSGSRGRPEANSTRGWHESVLMIEVARSRREAGLA